MLLGGLLLAVAAVTVAQRRAGGNRAPGAPSSTARCSYTFVLPEPEPCPPRPEGLRGSNSLRLPAARCTEPWGDWPAQQCDSWRRCWRQQWLQKLERYIQMNLRSELAQVQQHMVQNQTATMLELGTSLLNQTTAQTRKLTDVEAQVLNQTSRMEIQLLETSLSTNKLEKQLLLQGHELHRLQGRNKWAPASWHGAGDRAGERGPARDPPSVRAAEQVFQDCAEIQRFGANASGVYTIHVANMTEPRKGFGDPAGEHWLGNEVMHQLTGRTAYSLRVELQDWEGNEAYAQYEHFQLGSEGQLYRLSLSGYSGSAGRQSSLVLQGTNFSTRDADNDNCLCKCAQMLSGGWWFDACGLSNLNGIYYAAHHHVRKLNGIRWHYFQGPSYSLRATRMMVRPVGV
ncbi:LOW QUALITY PROTEIN: angiopoietin-4 [Puma concolor]|uniref:LOW QUALITY PROTEIN: angiopoietin-4 n=1 Tax=Puma concolor TaxID=9696 RepID=A0A6P6IK72_PUMCO|nr:LOW QUALITY PROTEIN: angiopoietin-4 [Puma concolor]